MSNTVNPQQQTLDQFSHKDHNHEFPQWESMARSWLSKLPDGRVVTPDDVEAWLQLHQASLPDGIKSMPRPQLYERFTSIQSDMVLSNEEKSTNQVDISHARFQRTDQWMPVYSWLESLDTDEVVKSKDILDWLSENPEIKEHLYSRHSRYHLMHYIKKCHMKILKRKEKKQGSQATNKVDTLKINKCEGTKTPVPLTANNLNSLPKDSDMYRAKRNEALHKYQILVELEKQLSTVFPKHENVC